LGHLRFLLILKKGFEGSRGRGKSEPQNVQYPITNVEGVVRCAMSMIKKTGFLFFP